MEASEYKCSDSCHVIGVKPSDVTESFCCNSEQPLQSNVGDSELTERRESSRAEDVSASDSNVLQRSAISHDVVSSCTDLETAKRHVISSSGDDNVPCSVCCMQDVTESVSVENAAMSTASEKNVDIVQRDVAESVGDLGSCCEYMTSADDVDSTSVAHLSKSRAVDSEQEVDCEVTRRRPVTQETVHRSTEHACVDTASCQNALKSQLYVQSEMEDVNAVTTDSCQYKELQQLCRHLQVTAEIDNYLTCFAQSPVTRHRWKASKRTNSLIYTQQIPCSKTQPTP